MKDELRKAGINTSAVRLNRVADGALDRAKGNQIKALQGFRITVLTDVELLRELIGQERVWKIAAAFLEERRKSWVPSRDNCESQKTHDRHPNSKRDTGSQKLRESQCVADPGVAPSRSGESQQVPESQSERDLPAAPSARNTTSQYRHESQWTLERRVAPSTRISKLAARSVASVFDERVSAHFEKTYGEITQYDYLNLRITMAGGEVLQRKLEKVKWPDMHTPLREFADPNEISAIRDERNEAVEKELSSVKRISHAAG